MYYWLRISVTDYIRTNNLQDEAKIIELLSCNDSSELRRVVGHLDMNKSSDEYYFTSNIKKILFDSKRVKGIERVNFF